MSDKLNNTRQMTADLEYNRLIELYKQAKVDEFKLKIYDNLIRKVAEVYAILESMKELPTILFDSKNPNIQKETPAGKSRIKYMAQYSVSMQKLNKDLLGGLVVDDDELDEFE